MKAVRKRKLLYIGRYKAKYSFVEWLCYLCMFNLPVPVVTSFYPRRYLGNAILLREGIVPFFLHPNNSRWCLPLAKVSNSSKSSNLCWFSDKLQHLVVLAWDAACTIGCCKLFAWSGPGTPHVMGNSLNSAHLGRQRRLDPFIFCRSSQPATAVATSHLPSSHCTWLQPHSRSSPTLGPRPVQPYLSICPRVCQARPRQRGPNICPLNIYSAASSAPTTAPATGSSPEPGRQFSGPMSRSSRHVGPLFSRSVLMFALQ